MRLYLLRHGEAVESPQYDDSQRPLTGPGRQQIQTSAKFLRLSQATIDIILSSPLVRARESAEIVKELFPATSILTTEYLLPGGSYRDLLREINKHETGSILLVGHEPHLGQLVSVLTLGDDRAGVEMKKASIACIENKTPVQKGGGKLLWLLTTPLMELMR